ncbi:MAG: hypothetical protein AAF702_29450 [Chloroflexota bacterium]
MYHVCVQCGEWEPDKEVRAVEESSQRAVAICSSCGYEHLFPYLPLFVVAGPSGSGKSTVCNGMLNNVTAANRSDWVILDSDILWGVAYTKPEEWTNYFDMWLRVCYNIHLSGRSVLLFGAGLNPDNVESRPGVRYFSAVHYLALVCDEDELASRLRARPQWRDSSGNDFIEDQLNYNRWFIEQGKDYEGSLTVLNTSEAPVEETIAAVSKWAV